MNKDELSVSLYPTSKCNFSCDYCYMKDYHYENDMSIEQIDYMLKNLSKYKLHSFTIFGGEPSYYKNVYYLIDAISEHCNDITIFTNGSNADFFDRLLSNKNIDNIHLRISCHPQYYKTFIKENLINFYHKFKNITTTNLLDATHKEEIYEYIEDSIKYGWKYYLTPVINDNDTNEYMSGMYWDENFVTKLKTNYNINQNSNNFNIKYLLHKCYNNFVTINPDGSTNYTQCHSHIKNNNIFLNDWTHKNIPVVCKKTKGIPCSKKCGLAYHEK